MAEPGDASSTPDTDEVSDAETAGDAETPDDGAIFSERMKVGIAIVALGVVVPGLVDNLLTNAGAPGLGVLVWTVGFGSAVVALWYVVLRPLDIGAETEA